MRVKLFNIVFGTICCGIFLILLIHVLISDPSKFYTSNFSESWIFRYEIHPECRVSKLIWIITSHAKDTSKRSALRSAYDFQELKELGIQRVFLLGTPDVSQDSGISQSAIEDEAYKFKDIVQGKFLESYRNLTLKHLMGLKWLVDNCNHTSYVMKMDDDIIVNVYEIFADLENIFYLKENNSLAGFVFDKKTPIRDPKGNLKKWYVTRDEYPADYYPRYLSGWMYLTTHPAASKLINRAKSQHDYFWIDDVFVTGILRKESNISLIDIQEKYTTDFRFLECCIGGTEIGLKCDFAVGPNYGTDDFQIQFKKFAQFCRTKCIPRPESLSIRNTCTVT